MITGLNLDPRRSPDLDRVAALGCAMVRVVLTRDTDPGWLEAVRRRGMRVLAVLDRASLGDHDWGRAAQDLAERYGHLVDAVQLGNEPDHVGPSSWTLAQDAYNALLTDGIRGWERGIRSRMPNAEFRTPFIGAGLVSGNPEWLRGVAIERLDAVGLHPYAETAATIAEFLARYRAVGARAFWVTESWMDLDLWRALARERDVQAAFAWWHDPDGSGLGIEHDANRQLAFRTICQQEHEREATVADIEQLEQRVALLERQQALQTEALRRILTGAWTGGAESAVAILKALNPAIDGEWKAFPGKA